MNDRKTTNPQVTIAIIGLIGTLVAVFITVWVTLKQDSSHGEIQTLKYSLRAEIDDPDGYVNVRSLPSIDGQILDTISKGETFYTHYQDSNWWHVKTPRNKIGYVHSSRIKLLE